MTTLLTRLTPDSLRGYQRTWLRTDIVAGVTLAAVAIPETMGYTSIAQVPVVTGLYTVIFPALLFALLGSSRLLVVGADSATAAILAAGLAGLGIAGLSPYSPEWLAFTSLTALICGGLLLLARLLRLGFIGDFLSSSVPSDSSPGWASRCSPARSPTCSASKRAPEPGSSSSGGRSPTSSTPTCPRWPLPSVRW